MAVKQTNARKGLRISYIHKMTPTCNVTWCSCCQYLFAFFPPEAIVARGLPRLLALCIPPRDEKLKYIRKYRWPRNKNCHTKTYLFRTSYETPLDVTPFELMCAVSLWRNNFYILLSDNFE